MIQRTGSELPETEIAQILLGCKVGSWRRFCRPDRQGWSPLNPLESQNLVFNVWGQNSRTRTVLIRVYDSTFASCIWLYILLLYIRTLYVLSYVFVHTPVEDKVREWEKGVEQNRRNSQDVETRLDSPEVSSLVRERLIIRAIIHWAVTALVSAQHAIGIVPKRIATNPNTYSCMSTYPAPPRWIFQTLAIKMAYTTTFQTFIHHKYVLLIRSHSCMSLMCDFQSRFTSVLTILPISYVCQHIQLFSQIQTSVWDKHVVLASYSAGRSPSFISEFDRKNEFRQQCLHQVDWHSASPHLLSDVVKYFSMRLIFPMKVITKLCTVDRLTGSFQNPFQLFGSFHFLFLVNGFEGYYNPGAKTSLWFFLLWAETTHKRKRDSRISNKWLV